VEGLAHWGPTVCRVVGGRLDVGAFYVPRLDELWFAARGAGAWRDGTRLAPPEPMPPERATVYLPSRAHRLPSLPWPGKSRALGSSAAHLAQVASGAAGATVVAEWELWDVGAGVLLVEEAGRVITDLDGLPLDPVGRRGLPLVASARTVTDPLVGAIRAARNPAAPPPSDRERRP
jgi:myo-inositol-1(or 4)-monophosphatase